MRWSRRERRWWFASLALVILIYSTLYIVRTPTEFLRERNLLRPAVATAFISAALPLLWLVRRSRPGAREKAVLVVCGGLFVWLIRLAELPEERIHFLEYGLLGGMLFQASRLRAERLGRSGSRAELGAAVLAMVLAGLAGWGDEGIQAVLPNRYYDLRDIVFNVVSSTVAVAALWLSSRARALDRRV